MNVWSAAAPPGQRSRVAARGAARRINTDWSKAWCRRAHGWHTREALAGMTPQVVSEREQQRSHFRQAYQCARGRWRCSCIRLQRTDLCALAWARPHACAPAKPPKRTRGVERAPGHRHGRQQAATNYGQSSSWVSGSKGPPRLETHTLSKQTREPTNNAFHCATIPSSLRMTL